MVPDVEGFDAELQRSAFPQLGVLDYGQVEVELAGTGDESYCIISPSSTCARELRAGISGTKPTNGLAARVWWATARVRDSADAGQRRGRERDTAACTEGRIVNPSVHCPGSGAPGTGSRDTGLTHSLCIAVDRVCKLRPGVCRSRAVKD